LGCFAGVAGKLEAEFDQHVQYSYNQGAKNDVQRPIAKLQKECELVNSSLSRGKACNNGRRYW
jgi:hypothetical protein